eukprot:1500228-Pyramimonas_sp.AAC.1
MVPRTARMSAERDGSCAAARRKPSRRFRARRPAAKCCGETVDKYQPNASQTFLLNMIHDP